MNQNLTSPMIEALKLLAIEPRRTYRITIDEWVAGTSASALCRRELAKRVYDHSPLEPGYMWDFSFKVAITDKGRELLNQIKCR